MGPTNILAFGAASAALARGGTVMRGGRRTGDGARHQDPRPRPGRGRRAVRAHLRRSLGGLVPAIYGSAYRPYVELAPFVALAVVVYTLDLIPTVRLRIVRRTRALFATRAGVRTDLPRRSRGCCRRRDRSRGSDWRSSRLRPSRRAAHGSPSFARARLRRTPRRPRSGEGGRDAPAPGEAVPGRASSATAKTIIGSWPAGATD